MEILENVVLDIDENEEDLQMAENAEVDDSSISESNNFVEKRKMLERTKIVKQSWSIREIWNKMRTGDLILDPHYQRSEVWTNEKMTAFIESLYMEIMIPPIYVVEVASQNLLDSNKYEVVDGKQRLTTIKKFIDNNLRLVDKYLEYYGDIFGGKNFNEIREQNGGDTETMLSSILDIYVITSESPEFTKYDIFSRLNKGAAPLRVNEIRRAIYQSEATRIIDEFVKKRVGDDADSILKEEYEKLFSDNAIKHFDDYGRFYKSIAFYLKTNNETMIVEGYNSRPREMINGVLEKLQKNEITIDNDKLNVILNSTLHLMELFPSATIKYAEHFVDACIPFSIDKMEKIEEKVSEIVRDDEINKTLAKSQSSTNNVNARIKRIAEILRG